MTKKIFWIFVIILASFCDSASVSQFEEEELDLSEDPEISSLLNKYDPDKTGFFTKENYKKLLAEILLVSVSEDTKLTALETSLMTNIIYNYIDNRKQETFSYENMLADLESDEIMNALLKGLSEANEKIQRIQDKKEQADKISKKEKKDKKKKKKEEKKNKKKQKNKEKTDKKEEKVEEGQCDIDQTDQCPIPNSEDIENSKEITEDQKIEMKSERIQDKKAEQAEKNNEKTEKKEEEAHCDIDQNDQCSIPNTEDHQKIETKSEKEEL